jgi:Bacterial Ig domain
MKTPNHSQQKQILIYVVAFLIAGSVLTSISSHDKLKIHAASNDTMYLSPSSGNHTVGSTFGVYIYENSNSDSVNAVEADLTYPTSKLQYISTSLTGTAFGLTASSTGGGGSVKLAVGTITPVSGTKLVGTVNFKALASGSASVPFAGTSAVESSTTNSNVLSGTTGGTYTISTPVSPSPNPAPSPSPTPSPSPSPQSAPPPVSPPKSSSTAPSNSKSTASNKKVTLNEQASTQENPNSGTITKVEYYLNGKLVTTVNNPPYTYTIDSRDLRNGTYQLTTKTYYANGGVDTKNTSLIVKNPLSLNQVRLQARHYTWAVIILILAIGYAVWYWIQRRENQWIKSQTNNQPESPNNPPSFPTSQ